MGLKDIFQKFQNDRRCEKLMERLAKYNKCQATAHKALSYRELGKYRTAEKLLLSIADDYPAAWVLLGNTYLLEKDLKKAQVAFKRSLENYADQDNMMGQIETYANIGQMYWKFFKNRNAAYKSYKKGLALLYQCKKDGRSVWPENVYVHSNMRELSRHIVNGIYLDLSLMLFENKSTHEAAAKWAQLRLKKCPSCPEASLVAGAVTLDNYLKSDNTQLLLRENNACDKLSKAIALLAISSENSEYQSAAQQLYATALFCHSCTRLVVTNTNDSVSTQAQLRELLPFSSTWNNFWAVVNKIFDELDILLNNDANILDGPATDFWKRPDARRAIFPKYGFSIEPADGTPLVAVTDSGTEEAIRYGYLSIDFLENYGPYLIPFIGVGLWEFVQHRFELWLQKSGNS